MTALLLLLLAAAPQDTLTLPALQDAAVARDPRTRQAALREEAARLRLRILAAERLPELALTGEASRQSEVAALPIRLPAGDPPTPPHGRYEAAAEGRLLLLDGGVNARRRAAEEAALQVERAELAATLFPVRAEVNEAYFAAYLLQERLRETGTLVEDLTARLATLRVRVREGAALPGDTAAVLAAILRAEQERGKLAAERRAALRVLGRLTGRTVRSDDRLVLPEPRVPPAGARLHPRFAVFAAHRARLAREADLAGAASRPRLSAFGRLAVGSPGYSQFDRDPHEYWIAGLSFRWTPWDRGIARRQRALIAVQQQILDTEEAAFAEGLQRQVADEREAVERLHAALATDARIIALREQVERQARAQFAERAITADQYVDARTDLQEARLARDRHRAELAQARVRHLTTLGLELR